MPSLDNMKMFLIVFVILANLSTLTFAQQKCGEAGKITVIGSTTVFPVSAAFALEYSNQCPQNNFDIKALGSEAGAKAVCSVPGSTAADIGNMSNNWRSSQATTLDNKTYKCVIGDTTRTIVQIPVAIDGTPVFVAKSSTIYTECLSKLPNGLSSADIRWIFSNLTNIAQPAFSDNKSGTWLWSEICGNNTNIPAGQEVNIYGPDPTFGTHQFFKEVIFTGGDGFRSGMKYFKDNDAPLRDAVANDPFGIGFFGYSYYNKNTAIIQAVKINGVEPTDENLYKDSYKPLGRRIFSNFWNGSLTKTACYGHYGLSSAGARIVDATGFLPIPETEYPELRSRLGVCGTSDAPTVAPTVRIPACKRYCFFFQSNWCCSSRWKQAGRCSCV